MFLCGLFKGEGKIVEFIVNWYFCMDVYSKLEILFKNFYVLLY